MKNDLDKLLYGFVLGGLVGGSIYYLLQASDKDKRLFFKRIQKILDEIGDILKEASAEDGQRAVEELIENLPEEGKLAHFLALTATGINLWKKWR